jgi:hypothetical protein
MSFASQGSWHCILGHAQLKLMQVVHGHRENDSFVLRGDVVNEHSNYAYFASANPLDIILQFLILVSVPFLKR